MLGSILSARNWSWFNAGPRLLVAAMGDNADMKFVQKTPILKETHEAVGTPAEQASCVAAQNTQTMLMNMQSGQALAMGYFGGYAGKEQKISQKDTERISEAFSRNIESDKGRRTSVAEKFHQCSRRIIKDVESKGMIRTAVEGVNLSEHAAAKDTLMAECLRTVADVTFQVQVLLKREEIETKKVSGLSVITPLHHRQGNRARAYAEAPFDLMYGFRGTGHEVDLFSAWEMVRYWEMVKIEPPNASGCRSTPTVEYAPFKEAENARGFRSPAYVPGVHYVAVAGEHRVLLPDLPVLRGLRHCWCWEKRDRPFLPLWSKGKMPDRRWSPEENSRLLSLYMRPWTLDERCSSDQNPLLSQLAILPRGASGNESPSAHGGVVRERVGLVHQRACRLGAQ